MAEQRVSMVEVPQTAVARRFIYRPEADLHHNALPLGLADGTHPLYGGNVLPSAAHAARREIAHCNLARVPSAAGVHMT